MSDATRSPLVPHEVDLRGLRSMPLDVDALLASDLMALATPEEGWAALKLWCRTWQNSGRLTNDDRVLAGYACAGDRKMWAKVKVVAMRGYVLCNDGNWYHETISTLAIAAWEARVKHRAKRDSDALRLASWRVSKAEKNAHQTPVGHDDERALKRVSSAFQNDDETHLKLLREGKGKGLKDINTSHSQTPGHLDWFATERAEAKTLAEFTVLARKALVAAGSVPSRINDANPAFAEAFASGVSIQEVQAAASQPGAEGKPFTYHLRTAIGRHKQAEEKPKAAPLATAAEHIATAVAPTGL
jgi:hypothetical protein